MSILINPKIVINLDELLYGTVVQTPTGNTYSLHKALQTYCMNLVMYNDPDPGGVYKNDWKDYLYNALMNVPKLQLHPFQLDYHLKLDLLLELCMQYIFDRSTGRTIPTNWNMIAWDEVHYNWTRNFKVPSI